MGQDAGELERQRRLAYRERVRQWQSFLDTIGRRSGYIPPDYPLLPPPPELPDEERLRAEAEAEALERLARSEATHERLQPGGRQVPDWVLRENPRFGEQLNEFEAFWSVRTPDMMAAGFRQGYPTPTPAEVYEELRKFYAQWQAEDVPFTDADLREAAGFHQVAATRGSWKLWDIYIFDSWAEALAFLRPQATRLTQERRPVMVNAGGVLRAWEGTRYVTHVDPEGYHGWVNIEASRLASSVVARASVIALEMAAKLSRVEAVALYIHK